MTAPKVELLYFPGCPGVNAARANLQRALEAFSEECRDFDEVNIHDPANPEEYRNWPSPSILVNGKDVEGGAPGDAGACRLYPGNGAPRLGKILAALEKEKRS